MTPSAVNPPPASGAVLEAARNGEFDRYIAALLAPPAVRPDLVALAAFAAELARIAPLTQREPAMGEIRLQWWREALENKEHAATGHPVADAVKDAARRHAWPIASLLGIIDAHAHDSLADPYADDTEMLDALALDEGALFALAACTLGAEAAGIAPIARSAGAAYGIARRLAALPQLVGRNHVPLPQARLAAAGVGVAQFLARDDAAGVRTAIAGMAALARAQLAAARPSVAKLPRRIRVGFLPLALVDPYLRVAEQAERNPLRDSVDLQPLRRLVRITGMHVFGRF